MDFFFLDILRDFKTTINSGNFEGAGKVYKCGFLRKGPIVFAFLGNNLVTLSGPNPCLFGGFSKGRLSGPYMRSLKEFFNGIKRHCERSTAVEF